MQPMRERTSAESYFWPSIWAIGLHVLIFALLFVSFIFTPDLPPAKPIVQVTLYQLKSKSPATTQTNQKIAGEAKKTAAKLTEDDQQATKKEEQEEVKAAEQKKAAAAQKAADAAKAADAKKAADAQKSADDAKKAAEAQKVAADIAKKKADDDAKKEAAEEAKQAADDAKKAAAAAAQKKAAEDAKKKAADDAKKKAAADDAKKKAQEKARKAADDKKAKALAELLSDDTKHEATKADEQGEEVAGDFDDLIRQRASEAWVRPPSARKGMTVVVQINMLPDGTITKAVVSKSSGDRGFDDSAVAAVTNIGRLTEMQGLKPAEFNPYRSFKMTFTPEDLSL